MHGCRHIHIYVHSRTHTHILMRMLMQVEEQQPRKARARSHRYTYTYRHTKTCTCTCSHTRISRFTKPWHQLGPRHPRARCRLLPLPGWSITVASHDHNLADIDTNTDINIHTHKHTKRIPFTSHAQNAHTYTCTHTRAFAGSRKHGATWAARAFGD